MMTIVTHVHLKEGAARDWETAMRTRLSAAKKRPGWVGGQLLRPADKPDRRVIVGTWRDSGGLGGVAPRPEIHGDSPAAGCLGKRTSRALVARRHP